MACNGSRLSGLSEHVDLVIVSCNALSDLQACIESVRRETYLPYRLIVVDNGSDAATLDFLQAQDDVVLIENGEKWGYAAAANRGIAAGQGEVVVMLEADVKVTPNWLEPLVATLCSDPAVAVVGPKLLNERGEEVSTGAMGTGGTRRLRNNAGGKYTGSVGVSGACFGMKRRLIPVLGLFDPAFFLYFHDLDYSFRARDLGYRVVCCPDSVVYHREHGPSMDIATLQKHFTQSRAIFEEKWIHTIRRGIAGTDSTSAPAAGRGPRGGGAGGRMRRRSPNRRRAPARGRGARRRCCGGLQPLNTQSRQGGTRPS